MEATGRRGITHISLDEDEATVFRGLLEEMRLLLEADIPQSDAVLQRLFPPAYETPDEQRAYEDLVRDELATSKRRALETVEAVVGKEGPVEAELDEEARDAWLTLLTDLRLAIGTRLDVTEEKMSAEPNPASPDYVALNVLHWLGRVQESILGTMLDDE